MKKILFIILLNILLISSLNSTVKSTFVFDFFNFIDGNYYYSIEKIVSYKADNNLTYLAKVLINERFDYAALSITGGVVYSVSKYGYVENTYGIRFDSSSNISHIINTDFFYERAAYLLNCGHRLTIAPGIITNLFSHSFKVYPIRNFSVFMKHYLGHEPYDRITNSLWSEIEYLINGIFGIKSGFTAGYFYYTFDNKYPVGFEYSAIAGLSLNFSKVNIKYNFEFSEKQLLYKTLKNSITLNIIF